MSQIAQIPYQRCLKQQLLETIIVTYSMTPVVSETELMPYRATIPLILDVQTLTVFAN